MKYLCSLLNLCKSETSLCWIWKQFTVVKSSLIPNQDSKHNTLASCALVPSRACKVELTADGKDQKTQHLKLRCMPEGSVVMVLAFWGCRLDKVFFFISFLEAKPVQDSCWRLSVVNNIIRLNIPWFVFFSFFHSAFKLLLSSQTSSSSDFFLGLEILCWVG